MPRVFIIERCDECKYVYKITKKLICCGHSKQSGKDISPYILPPWCPLPSASNRKREKTNEDKNECADASVVFTGEYQE